MGVGGCYGIEIKEGHLFRNSALREALNAQELVKVSPGVDVATLAQKDLGCRETSGTATKACSHCTEILLYRKA
jgi:hypothetical protein